jgi:hypothetical protein
VRPLTAAWGLAAYCLLLALILLNPSADLPTRSVLWATEMGDAWGAPAWALASGRPEVLLNVAIVVPVPLLGSFVWRGWTWRDWTAYGFVASSAVELAQGLLLPLRSASHMDVVANTLGAAAGAVVAALFARWRARERQPSTR